MVNARNPKDEIQGFLVHIANSGLVKFIYNYINIMTKK